MKKPSYRDPSLDVLIQRGQEHETAYVEFLSKEGLKVVDLKNQSIEATLKAMAQGVDVIVQAKLENGPWMGYADILLKVSGESRFGNWCYEVQDTKLAQNTRAATILQLCLYTDLLSTIQGTVPEKMYVVKPGENFPTESYRFAEFQAYYRLVKKNFESIIADTEQHTYPDPVEHCNICRWWQVCDKKRHADDHLSLVAGLRSLHIGELQRQKIQTLEQFATVEKLEKPERGNRETFLRKKSQAEVQLKGRQEHRLLHIMLPVETGRGLNRLTEPNEGDIYFDIEGDNYFEDGGLEYVLGYAFREKKNLTYQRLWSTNRLEEKKAFSQFMQFVLDRWKRFPKMYIYHFAPYEPSTIKRFSSCSCLIREGSG
ncbi:MAG: TM0106 family RecB-like putative nuclease [Cytophagales bacterium]|nr:TM0106 family RecB-like putative nuclease [Cytophagales bacterium]